jgi:hypothetical protein
MFKNSTVQDPFLVGVFRSMPKIAADNTIYPRMAHLSFAAPKEGRT